MFDVRHKLCLSRIRPIQSKKRLIDIPGTQMKPQLSLILLFLFSITVVSS